MTVFALYKKYRDLENRLLREKLGSWPTPLQPLEKLSACLGGRNILVKRDDLASPVYGGNKVRKLELILAEAKLKGNRQIITAGGLGSHHVLATAGLHAVRVVQPGILKEARITGLASSALSWLAGKGATGAVKKITGTGPALHLDGGYLGEGYGFSSAKSAEAVRLFRDLEGIEPEECYTAKAAAALIDYCRRPETGRTGQHFLANCCALNLKFEKSFVSGPKGSNLLLALVGGYFDQGGMQVQINIQDSSILLLAHENPADYPGLMVRVSGYCSYFRDLSPEVRQEIIERTNYGAAAGQERGIGVRRGPLE